MFPTLPGYSVKGRSSTISRFQSLLAASVRHLDHGAGLPSPISRRRALPLSSVTISCRKRAASLRSSSSPLTKNSFKFVPVARHVFNPGLRLSPSTRDMRNLASHSRVLRNSESWHRRTWQSVMSRFNTIREPRNTRPLPQSLIRRGHARNPKLEAANAQLKVPLCRYGEDSDSRAMRVRPNATSPWRYGLGS